MYNPFAETLKMPSSPTSTTAVRISSPRSMKLEGKASVKLLQTGSTYADVITNT